MYSNRMITISLVLISIFADIRANAQSLTAAQGLEKFKYNADAAQKNKVEISRNLDLVTKNAAEVKKVKETARSRDKAINSELVKNAEAFKKINAQEKDLQAQIAKEKDKMQTENQQMQQLQSLMAQIQQNQAVRNQLISDYQKQLDQLNLKRNEWKEREEKLKTQEAQSQSDLKAVNEEEANWTTKKSKYEKDTKHWANEAAQHQKISDTYQGIAEGQ